jgi:hypothetical protein
MLGTGTEINLKLSTEEEMREGMTEELCSWKPK